MLIANNWITNFGSSLIQNKCYLLKNIVFTAYPKRVWYGIMECYKNVFQASSSYFNWLNYISYVLILSKVLVMPCFEITSVWRGYHILIYYVIQCAHAYINPGVYKTHKVFLFIKCTWKILGLRILSDTAFKIHIYSFENIIMSNINGWDTLKMEC